MSAPEKPEILPDLPGLVPGIKHVSADDVLTIQCGQCGALWTGEKGVRVAVQVAQCPITFYKENGYAVRLCEDCGRDLVRSAS